MKTIILILTLVSFNSFAGFVAGSKINQCNRTDYASQSTCQESESDDCYQVPNDSGECGIFKVQDKMIDDLSNPIWATRSMVEPCSDEGDCKSRHEAKVCVDDRSSFYSVDDLEVWCNKIIGYDQIASGKEMVIDPVLKAAKDIEKAQGQAIFNLVEDGRKAREACQKVLDLIGGFNLMPGRTTEQAGEMVASFDLAKSHLQDGRPGAAKIAIQAIEVDGVLVTQQMKDLALSFLAGY